jgi:hypothetical protein
MLTKGGISPASYFRLAMASMLSRNSLKRACRPSLAHPDATAQIWVRDLASHALLRLHILHGKINCVGLGDDQSCICASQRHTNF